MNSEFIFCSVCSVSTFSAVLDSLEHADSGKNFPVKLFNVYLEISGVLSGGRPNLPRSSMSGKLRGTSKMY